MVTLDVILADTVIRIQRFLAKECVYLSIYLSCAVLEFFQKRDAKEKPFVNTAQRPGSVPRFIQ